MIKLVALTVLMALSVSADYKYTSNKAASKLLSYGAQLPVQRPQAQQFQRSIPAPVRPVQQVQSQYGSYGQQVETTTPFLPPVEIQRPVQSVQYGQQQTFQVPEPVRQTFQQQSYGSQQIELPKPVQRLQFQQSSSYGQQVETTTPLQQFDSYSSYGQQQVIQTPLPKLPVPQQSSYSSYSQQAPIRSEEPISSNPCLNQLAGAKLEDTIQFVANQYIHCLEEGEWKLMRCPGQTVFNTMTDRCENSLRAPKGCLSNPCQNNGKCLDMPSTFSFRCECPVGFAGETCERTDVCENDMSCGAEGICVPLAPGAPLAKYCLCSSLSTYGLDCSKSVEANPCLTNDQELATFPSRSNAGVYVQCEGNMPHLRFCIYPLVYNHELQQCDWTASSSTAIIPASSLPQSSYGSYSQQFIEQPRIQQTVQVRSGY